MSRNVIINVASCYHHCHVIIIVVVVIIIIIIIISGCSGGVKCYISSIPSQSRLDI